MKNYTRMITGIFLSAAALLTAACPDRVSIADIQANPAKYAEKDVVIAGTVKDSYGLNVPGTPIRGGSYKIDDGTGSIWVVTEDAVPLNGVQIGVKGRIGSGISWKGRNYGLGMYEKDRRSASR